MGWNWNDVSIAAGAPAGTVGSSTVAAYVCAADGTQHVFYSSAIESHVHELWCDKRGWHFDDLALRSVVGSIGARSAWPFESQLTQHVVCIGEDFQIHELYRDHLGWHANDLTVATGVPSGLGLGPGEPTPSGYVFASQGTQHVNYRRNDGHIVELFWDGHWHFNDLTVAACATDAPNSQPVGYTFDAQATQHVIYRGSDSHIIELFWQNGVWNVNDLTAATGGPLASNTTAMGASGYVFAAQGTQHVIFLGEDFHIHEFWWDGNGWHHNDLTTASGAPVAADVSFPTGYVFAAQGTQHVNYWGADAHIHERWWDSNGWHHNDLTLASGAPDSTGYPVGYGFDAQGTQHVFFRNPDSNVTQLTWTP